MPEAEIDPDVLRIIEDIRQEVEDMAYDKLRDVLSDFSLKGVELNEKLLQHRAYIKAKAREIVKKRLDEAKIPITEEEFWCICGKYKKPISLLHPKRKPLFDVKKMTEVPSVLMEKKNIRNTKGSLGGSVQESNKGSSNIAVQGSDRTDESITEQTPDAAKEREIESIDVASQTKIEVGDTDLDITRSDKREISRIPDSRSLQIDHAKKLIAYGEPTIASIQSSLKKLDKKPDTKPYGKPTMKNITAEEKQQPVVDLQVFMDNEVVEQEKNAEVLEEKIFVTELDEYDNTYVEAVTSQELLYLEDSSRGILEQQDIEQQFEVKLSQRDIEMSLYGEAFYDVCESFEEENTWIVGMLNELIDLQHIRVITDMLQDKELDTSDLSRDISSSETVSSSESVSIEEPIKKFTKEDLEYLKRAFGNSLELAIADVMMKMPTCPLAYIAQYLLINKSDIDFDRSKIRQQVKTIAAKSNIQESMVRLQRQKDELHKNGVKLNAIMQTNIGATYQFNNVAKITLRRGRRIRRDIIDICDKLLTPFPILNLASKLRRMQTLDEIFGYANTLLTNLIREENIIKYETILKIYNNLVNFLKPVLPELMPIVNVVCRSSIVAPFAYSCDTQTCVTEDIPEECTSDEKITEQERKYRVKPNEYPCKVNDPQLPYQCRQKLKDRGENTKFEKMLDVLMKDYNPMQKINHIDRETACAMCQQTLNLIEDIKKEEDEIRKHLVEYITEQYITVSLESMFDNQYKFRVSSKQQDIEILQDIFKIIDKALAFEDPSDRSLVKEMMYKRIRSILKKQGQDLRVFTMKEKDLAVEEFKQRLGALVDTAQSAPEDHPCTCESDTKRECWGYPPNEHDWSDDEYGLLDAAEQQRMDTVMHRVAHTVEKIALHAGNLVEIQRILESFVTRGYRPEPYLSKRAHQDMIRLHELIAAMFGEHEDGREEEETDYNAAGEDGKVCGGSPCVCKYILHVSGLFVALHSRMLKKFDALRKAERDELELEIMKMFASFVDGLTLQKIQNQNLCTTNL